VIRKMGGESLEAAPAHYCKSILSYRLYLAGITKKERNGGGFGDLNRGKFPVKGITGICRIRLPITSGPGSISHKGGVPGGSGWAAAQPKQISGGGQRSQVK